MNNNIITTLENQREYFANGPTWDIDFRLEQLKKLRKSITDNSDAICEALHKDLHKSVYESYMTEIGIVLGELRKHIRHLCKWSRPKKVASPIFLFPSKSKIVYEPLGLVLIIAPWNYPFQLLINPLVGAISAGNVVALKSSPHAPETSKIMAKIIAEVFDRRLVSFFEGGRDVNTELLAQRFDHIFFTGSSAMGRVVMEAASRNLTPVTLELGGKSPCIADQTADLRIAAKRIVWGKLINSGQTCVAPDYLFVHRKVKAALIENMIGFIIEFYGEDPASSPNYPRMINDEEYERVAGLITSAGNVIYGGKTDPAQRYISPTLIDGITEESPIMRQEIFGPLLPIMEFDDISEVTSYINRHEKPLALYVFGEKKVTDYVIASISSGGACVNDTILHLSNDNLPFGGVGNSGMGRYHGHYSFLTFSRQRSVLSSSTKFDMGMKYPPYKDVKILKWFM